MSTRYFYLDGYRLAAAPPPAPGRRDYHGDPLAGLAAGIWDPFGTGHGWPEEQSRDDARSLTFTSDPLPEALLLAGAPEADLLLDPPPDTGLNLVARVCVVGPDGRSTLITTGWHRIPATGGAGAAARMVTVRLGAAAFELPAGSRVRLCVACADFPHIWPSPANPSAEPGDRAGHGPGPPAASQPGRGPGRHPRCRRGAARGGGPRMGHGR